MSNFACIACGGPTKTIDTRSHPEWVYRRRACLQCDERVTTHERAVDESHRNSDVTARLVDMLTSRDKAGRLKYGVTLDSHGPGRRTVAPAHDRRDARRRRLRPGGASHPGGIEGGTAMKIVLLIVGLAGLIALGVVLGARWWLRGRKS